VLSIVETAAAWTEPVTSRSPSSRGENE
jgi:hypothetical protein